MGYIYIVKQKEADLYKIGSTKNLNQRTRTIFNMNGGGVDIVCLLESDLHKEDEKQLHRWFRRKRKNGEWFELDEKCFDLIQEKFKEKIICGLRGCQERGKINE
jgi:prolyl oligopeptidase PreP (S9A serine peptidase family)